MNRNPLTLCLHAGGREVSDKELLSVRTPEATETWQPIPHYFLFQRIVENLKSFGYRVSEVHHALSHSDNRYFGVYGLQLEGSQGTQILAGARNCHDKEFPAGLLSGSRVFVCDNLAFSSEVVISRRHTKNIFRDLPGLINVAVSRFATMKVSQDKRYAAYANLRVSRELSHDFMIQSWDAGIITSGQIGLVLNEYRQPTYQEFSEVENGWRLFNAFTTVLKDRVPLEILAKKTTTLHGMLDAVCGLQAG